ncbi:uncharacterized protein IUM83_08739 [Phytophthora cinnamomi]|uniref:uncharacterized protein n=1 Tax=Phytophthora cinnamomi TaxID=4785 RepID=UPI002A321480|nr:hypothetical protein IUM83_08739 [Phytophthora cinnamomi]KAJ8574986.1 hypothetical protein ON010_g4226 [Phytophthora cinnamomi]
MWTSVTQEQIDRLAIQAFLPVVLLLNYTLLMYLAVFYWERRRERRVVLLLFVGTLGTVAEIPFARPDEGFVETVNDISEACCVLTFLLQITIIGYDLNKKFKMRSIVILTYAAEVLILADIVSILLSFAVLINPDVMSDAEGQLVSNIAENANLAFIFIFRFYYIGISRGWGNIWKTRKFEVCCYLLFATHEIPFDVVSSASGLNWEFVQAIWHRTTLTACLLITARTKIKQFSVTTTNHRTNIGSVKSNKEKWKADLLTENGSGESMRRALDRRISVFLPKSGGRSARSGGRRSTGPQICVTTARQSAEP